MEPKRYVSEMPKPVTPEELLEQARVEGRQLALRHNESHSPFFPPYLLKGEAQYRAQINLLNKQRTWKKSHRPIGKTIQGWLISLFLIGVFVLSVFWLYQELR